MHVSNVNFCHLTQVFIAGFSEICNCATRSHFALYVHVCMYLCQSRLGPGAYQVTSYASAVRVSRGYVVCARARRVVTWFAHVSYGYMVCARARVAWLHGLQACRVVTWFA